MASLRTRIADQMPTSDQNAPKASMSSPTKKLPWSSAANAPRAPIAP